MATEWIDYHPDPRPVRHRRKPVWRWRDSALAALFLFLALVVGLLIGTFALQVLP